MRYLLFATLIFVAVSMIPAVGQAQTGDVVPPGKAIVFGPFGSADQPATIKDPGEVDAGEVLLTDGKTRLVFIAPAEVEKAETVTLVVEFENSVPAKAITVTVDPAYSAIVDSTTAKALEWLFVLFVFALFIEAAVLVFVAVVRALIRLKTGQPSDPATGFKPSVYKPIFALALSILAVRAFEIDPMSEIMVAFGNIADEATKAWLPWAADGVISALLLAGGAESVRRIGIAIQGKSGLPNVQGSEQAAEAADTGQAAQK